MSRKSVDQIASGALSYPQGSASTLLLESAISLGDDPLSSASPNPSVEHDYPHPRPASSPGFSAMGSAPEPPSPELSGDAEAGADLAATADGDCGDPALEGAASTQSSQGSGWVWLPPQRVDSMPDEPGCTVDLAEPVRHGNWVLVKKQASMEMGEISGSREGNADPPDAEGDCGEGAVHESPGAKAVEDPGAKTFEDPGAETVEGAIGGVGMDGGQERGGTETSRSKASAGGDTPRGCDDGLAGMNLGIAWGDLHLGHPRVVLGEGAFGKVYKAEYGGQPVAVKRFSPSSAEVANADVMANELRILGAAGPHENLVRCYGGCLAGPCIFIVEELMHCTLHELVHSCEWGPRPMPVRQLLRLAMDITSGLCHLHPKIVHRDLKPQNILLSKDGRAKVADFGLSRVKASTYLKTRNHLAGTIEYMAPECINSKNVTHKSDLYSLALILWECLTGSTPYKDYDHAFAIMFTVASNGTRPQFPEDVHCPPGLKQLICDCWSQEPRDRPCCEEVLTRLRELEMELFGDVKAQR
ncbi:unnamed protein product [Ostreobium quekettii]|uniref:Protein kinase domain-containing protein n=1 Tax=Ostreobium quekettii TaxID=121088 RepID=A0A8S1J7P5_9CHLO|nr:unnamed protein product [Ostreobium quekettii]